MEKLKCKICGHLDGEVKKTSCGQGVLHVNPEEYIKSNLTEIMVKEGCCFNCAFWLNKIEVKDKNTFIINGGHYHSSEPYIDKTKVGGFLGFSGRDFYIKKENGELLHANNLWFQGEVPTEFKDKLPDNAEFISKEEYLLNICS